MKPLWDHFGDIDTQKRALHMGMWLFVASEVLLFAGLFALYTAYRASFPAQFAAAAGHNQAALGTANTALLLVSSFTMAASIALLKSRGRRACLAALGATALLGAGFLVIKGFEYHHHISQGIVPGADYHFEELASRGAVLFFTLYYLMTGLHAIHMLVGLGVVSWIALRVHRERITADYHPGLEMTGLYWHLVDCIWIFLWPLFYLLR